MNGPVGATARRPERRLGERRCTVGGSEGEAIAVVEPNRAVRVRETIVGSSTSKRRKGHEHPQHLPKVGTPAQQAWDRENRIKEVFGATWMRWVVMVIVVLAVIGLIFLFVW